MDRRFRELKKLWGDFIEPKKRQAEERGRSRWEQDLRGDDFLIRMAAAFEKLRPFLSVTDKTLYFKEVNDKCDCSEGSVRNENDTFGTFLLFLEKTQCSGNLKRCIIWTGSTMGRQPTFDEFILAVKPRIKIKFENHIR